MENQERPLLYKITFVCFSIFIISSGISITFSQGMLLLTLILWAYGCFNRISGFEYYSTGLERHTGIFIIISIILALLSPSRLENLLYLRDFWLISAFVLAGSLIATRKDAVRIVYLFIAVAVFQFAAGLIQYFTEINYLNAFKYGLGDPRAQLPYETIISGFLGHHLTFGGYMMMISIPLFYLAFLKKSDSREVPVHAVRWSSVFSAGTIILSWARSVLLSIPFALSPFVLKRVKSFLMFLVILIAAIIIGFAGFGLSCIIFPDIFDNSSIVRIEIWRNAFSVFMRNPVVGAGGGNYKKIFLEEVNKNKRLDNIYFESLSEYRKYRRKLAGAKKSRELSAAKWAGAIDEFDKAYLALTGAENACWGLFEDDIPEEVLEDYDSAEKKLQRKYYEYLINNWVILSAESDFQRESRRHWEVEKNYPISEVLFVKYFRSRATHAHNDYLNQLARKGIIGLLAFLYMLFGILKYIFNNYRYISNNFMRYFYMGLSGSVTAFLFASMFQCYFTDDENLVMFWLNVGILAGIVKVSRKNTQEYVLKD